MDIRIGNGYDIHRLIEGRDLFLCGIKIPFEFGLHGHSDGDCVLHAVADCLLGAIGERDIGFFFPDTDEKLRGISSKKIVEFARAKLEDSKYTISNIDITIIAARPKLSQYIDDMKYALSEILQINISQIGIKAKTNNGVSDSGFVACFATCLVVKQ